jgi:hypothetical protein
MSHLTRAERLILILLLALVAGVSAWRFYRFFRIQNNFPSPLESQEKTEKP